jgi:hypothetical protein
MERRSIMSERTHDPDGKPTKYLPGDLDRRFKETIRNEALEREASYGYSGHSQDANIFVGITFAVVGLIILGLAGAVHGSLDLGGYGLILFLVGANLMKLIRIVLLGIVLVVGGAVIIWLVQFIEQIR